MPPPFRLTGAQRDALEQTGVLRLPGFVPAPDVEAMAAALWDDLSRRFGMLRGRPETWTTVRPSQFASLAKTGAFAALGSGEMCALADALLGRGAWSPPRRWGLPLVTFPAPAWDMPRVMWHLDYPVTDPAWPLPALKLFAFLEPVAPHGGGTLYVAGSHRVAEAATRRMSRPTPSAKVRERLEAEHPWFARLWATPGDEVRAWLGQIAPVGGVEVSVEEMTGRPGDLVLMHPAVLHGLAHNALDRPRMMLTHGLARRDAPL